MVAGGKGEGSVKVVVGWTGTIVVRGLTGKVLLEGLRSL